MLITLLKSKDNGLTDVINEWKVKMSDYMYLIYYRYNESRPDVILSVTRSEENAKRHISELRELEGEDGIGSYLYQKVRII